MLKLAALALLALPTLAQAQSNCYSTSSGPIMRCYEGNRPVTVRKRFVHNGQQYAWDHQMRSYCFLNEYGNPHCMQEGQVNALRCAEGKGGELTCH